MGKMSSYSIAIMCSLVLHVGLGVFIVNKWEPEHERQIVAPKYIVAELVELKPKAEPKPKPKKQDNAAQQRRLEQERRKKAEADKRRKEAARKKAEAEKRRQAEAEKRRKAEAEKKRKAEEERERQQELARKKQLEEDMLAALGNEQEMQIAETDEETANAYSSVIRRRVSGNWNRPPSARRGMEAEVLIKLIPNGRVVNVTVVKSSGNAAFDRSVEQAILKAESFPELQKLESRVFEKYFRNLRLVFRPEDLRL